MLWRCRGYINYYSVYLFWLGSAVFIHLPSFQSMGIDVKADISMLLTIFLLSLLVRVPVPSFNQLLLAELCLHLVHCLAAVPTCLLNICIQTLHSHSSTLFCDSSNSCLHVEGACLTCCCLTHCCVDFPEPHVDDQQCFTNRASKISERLPTVQQQYVMTARHDCMAHIVLGPVLAALSHCAVLLHKTRRVSLIPNSALFAAADSRSTACHSCGGCILQTDVSGFVQPGGRQAGQGHVHPGHSQQPQPGCCLQVRLSPACCHFLWFSWI